MKPAEHTTRVRIWIEKRGRYRFVSHLGMVVGLRRALRRSGLPVLFSQGFHPLPRLSFGQALRLGYESFGEPVDIHIEGNCQAGDVKDILKRELPEGMQIKKAELLEPGSRKCATAFKRAVMGVSFTADGPMPAPPDRPPAYESEIIAPPVPVEGSGTSGTVRYRLRVALPVERSSKAEEIARDMAGDREITSVRVVRETFLE